MKKILLVLVVGSFFYTSNLFGFIQMYDIKPYNLNRFVRVEFMATVGTTEEQSSGGYSISCARTVNGGSATMVLPNYAAYCQHQLGYDMFILHDYTIFANPATAAQGNYSIVYCQDQIGANMQGDPYHACDYLSTTLKVGEEYVAPASTR